MQIKHHDFGALVIGREILKKFPQAQMEIKISPDHNFYEDFPDIWKNFLKSSVIKGNLGIFGDRKNKSPFSAFFPSDNNIKFFPHQGLLSLAHEGMTDSVEFRRLARKFIRPAKHAHIRTLFCPDLLLASEKTPKILQHLAGTQMRILTITDVLQDNLEKFFSDISSTQNISVPQKRKISITIDKKIEPDLAFAQTRIQKILRTKVRKEDITV